MSRLPTVTAVVSKMTNRVSLVQGNDYLVIGVHCSDYHIVDEAGEAVLYPMDYFIDDEVSCPPDWQLSEYDEGGTWCYPVEFCQPGFFEDLDERCADAVEIFRRFLKEQRAL